MEDNILFGFVQPILGKYHITAKSNIAFRCPFGSPHEKCQLPNKFKLEVNFVTNEGGENPWHCWVCGAKGKTIRSLLKKLNVSEEKIRYIQSYIKKDNVAAPKEIGDFKQVSLPREYIPLHIKSKDRDYKQALSYCKSRGLSNHDLIKYNIGYCTSGKYANTIIFPSYDKNGELNYFLSRSYIKNARSFNAPVCDKESIIGFEFFINWNTPIILTEGPFDAATIKRNVIPLFGKTIPKALMKRLIQPDVHTIYLALDKDAIVLSFKYAEELISMGKEVYMIELPEKDPNELGFEAFTKLLHTATPLTFNKMFSLKLELT